MGEYVSTFSFFFNDTATTEIYTLSLHDALPICALLPRPTRLTMFSLRRVARSPWRSSRGTVPTGNAVPARSEEHTSELQSRLHLVCRLLLEKKKVVLTASRLLDILALTSVVVYE